MDQEVLRLVVAMHRLTRRARRGALPTSLHPTQFVALMTVAELQPIRIGAIATHVPCPQPTATMAVAALETAGLVRRQPDADDRRAVVVVLTSKGQREIETLAKSATATVGARLDRLSEEERRLVLDAGAVLARMTEDDRRI